MKKATICTIGPGVLDERFRPSSGIVASAKRDCEVTQTLGGGSAGVAGTLEVLGGDVTPILFTGSDYLQSRVEQLAHSCLPGSLCVDLMEQTRRSLVTQHDVLTIRSRLKQATLPTSVRESASTADITVIGPMMPADFGFIRKLIAASNETVLMMSDAQLIDQDAAFHVAADADLVVVNEHEAQCWTGRTDPIEAANVARSKGVKHLIITRHDRATLAIPNADPIQIPAFKPRRISKTVGAGDRFAGGLVYALSNGARFEDAIRFAHAAALLWIEGDLRADVHEAIQTVLAERDTAEETQPQIAQSTPVRMGAIGVAVAAGALFGIGLGMWL